MSHDANVTRWYFSDQNGKDQIIVNMMNRLEELERYKLENESRKGGVEPFEIDGAEDETAGFYCVKSEHL